MCKWDWEILWVLPFLQWPWLDLEYRVDLFSTMLGTTCTGTAQYLIMVRYAFCSQDIFLWEDEGTQRKSFFPFCRWDSRSWCLPTSLCRHGSVVRAPLLFVIVCCRWSHITLIDRRGGACCHSILSCGYLWLKDWCRWWQDGIKCTWWVMTWVLI
jgi:hypothetical protein